MQTVALMDRQRLRTASNRTKNRTNKQQPSDLETPIHFLEFVSKRARHATKAILARFAYTGVGGCQFSQEYHSTES